METTLLKLTILGSFFVLIFFSGYWLNRSGKPYHAAIFSLHKLIGLAAGIYLIISVYQRNHITALNQLHVTAVVVTVLCFVVTVIAGGLSSIDKPMPLAVSIIHKIFPYISLLSTAVTLYLLLHP